MSKTALIAMSGGVDSSVSAVLMLERGYTCMGATMKLYDISDAPVQKKTKTCCSDQDIYDAAYVAIKLGMKYEILDLSAEFADRVIKPFIATYEAGGTPNPCIECNRYLKFAALRKCANDKGFDYVVTGHYARIEYDEGRGRWLLKRGLDPAKDQSYVLYSMTQDELAKKVGKNRSTVANSLRLLALSPEMQGDLLAGNINAGQARALLSVVNPADRLKLYEHLKEKELSVRATERLAAAYNEGKRVAFQKKKRKVKDLEDSPEVTVVKEKLFQALGKPVEIKGTIDSGKLVIPYDSADELDQICELLAHEEEE